MTNPSEFTQTSWELSDLFSGHNNADMQAAFKTLEQKVADFEKRREDLSAEMDISEFMAIIHQLEAIQELAARIQSFAGLSFAADTQNQEIQAFSSNVDQTMAQAENRILFFSLWWKAMDAQEAERFISKVGDYRYWLEEIRHFKPHTLSEAEEKIINIKNVTGVNALTKLYDSITNRYKFRVRVDGEEKELTRGELMVFARHSEPGLRAAAYQELYRVYGEDGTVLGQIYQTLVRDWRNEQIDLRRFGTPIAARNLMNDIPDAVTDTLLDVCQKNADVFQRFFRLKASLLGMERLRRYDIYAPVVKSDKTYRFETAAGMVLDAFQQFDPRVSDLASRVFQSNHLDSQVRKGKRGGAFCWSVTPELTPWVHLNYQGRPEDVATMAHELGHAVHSMLAADHSLLTWHATLPLAETASTFGEMLLLDRLLAQEQDESVRRDLLFRQIDDSYATILRQAFFALFERQAHEMVQQGASVEALADAYLQNLQVQFGEAVEISDEFRWEWVSIPHIYQVPFYVYAYAFGQLLVLSLYQQYQAEGETFKPRYLKILSAGGSKAPADILTQAGIDIYSLQFWQGGFAVLRNAVEKLEKISQ